MQRAGGCSKQVVFQKRLGCVHDLYTVRMDILCIDLKQPICV